MEFMKSILLVVAIVGSVLVYGSSASTSVPEEKFEEKPLDSYFLSANVAERSGDIERAADGYLSALALDPQNITLMEKAFTYQLASGQIETAIDLAKRISQTGDATPLVHILLGVGAAKDKKYDEAIEHIDDAIAGSTTLLQFELLKAYIQLENGTKGEDVLRSLGNFQAHPTLRGYQYYHLGRIEQVMGNQDNAMAYYARAMQEDKGSIFVATALGELLELKGGKDKAELIYKGFLERNPDSVLLYKTLKRMDSGKLPNQPNLSVNRNIAEVMFGFSTLMVNQGLNVAAQQLMQAAIYMDKTLPYSSFYLGVLEEQQGRPEAALEAYARVSKAGPAWVASQVRIALIESSMGNYKKANERLTELSAQYSDIPLIYSSLADLNYDAKKYKSATRYYTVALNKISDVNSTSAARLYFSRGAAYERLQDFERATADLEASLSIQPDNPVVLNYLGYMMVDLDKEIDRAFAMIGKALMLKPSDGAITDSLGWAYYKKGEYEKALKFLERAVELLPTDPIINAHLGDVYEKVGRDNEAQIQWKRAMSLGLDEERYVSAIQQKIKQ